MEYVMQYRYAADVLYGTFMARMCATLDANHATKYC